MKRFPDAFCHEVRRRRARTSNGELLLAALRVFSKHGYVATRMDDIAAMAGISKGALYLHFLNKEELFKAVVRENAGFNPAEIETLVERSEVDCQQLLRIVLHEISERLCRTPLSDIARLVVAEAGNFPELLRFYYEEVVVPIEAIVTRVLLRGVDRGEFRIHDVAHGASIIVAPMMLSAMSHSSEMSIGKECGLHEDLLADLLFSGLVQTNPPSS
ncbi:TetR/AcrR family transcriptional regulator [Noviherbaspirillum saxi]|uniref:TetR/AcrR family transcriptional regulator n=1 Tax=Noviherbaspirillum saxi TaxID=2320863 RepID=A0A3A3FTP6_9BURK|nr:TetR/AcrR family transcriptional regulator [Noviherbaspirillum saxi]RJF98634.1 TetR/AcrR family transcriptional regulator [Noviherbaspirillum saxi]